MSGIPATIIVNEYKSTNLRNPNVIILKPAEAKLRLYKSIFTQKLTGAENKLTVTKNK